MGGERTHCEKRTKQDFALIMKFIFATICFMPLITLAQGDYRNGFIIKTNGDSIGGFVDYRTDEFSSKVCLFKFKRGQKKIRYLPEDLKGYGFINDKYHETREVAIDGKDKELAFMEILVKGNISLLKFSDLYYIEKDSLFLLPENTKEVVRQGFVKTDMRYVGILNYILSDCNLKADETKYEEKDLTNLIQNYNRCKGIAGKEYKVNQPWLRPFYSAFAGLDNSQFKLDNYEVNTFKPSLSATGGLSVDLSSPRLYDKIFLVTELWLVKKLYQGYSELKQSNETIRSDIFLNESFIKIPIGFRFNFLSENRTPYVKFGVVRYISTKSSFRIVNESEANGTVESSELIPNFEERQQRGIWFSVGYNQIMTDRLKAFTEIRFEKCDGFIGPIIQSMSTSSNFNFIIGVRF